MRWLLILFFSISTLSAQNWVYFDNFNSGIQNTDKWDLSTEGGDANITFDPTEVKFNGSGSDEPYSAIQVKIDNRTFSGIRAKLKLDSTSSNDSTAFVSIELGRFYVDMGVFKKSDGSVVIYYEVEEDVTDTVVNSGELSANSDQFYDLAINYTASQINFLLDGAIIHSYEETGLIPIAAHVGGSLDEPVSGSYLTFADDVQLYQGTGSSYTIYDSFWGANGSPSSSFWDSGQSNGGNSPVVNNGVLTLYGLGYNASSFTKFNQSLTSVYGIGADIALSSTASIQSLGGLWLQVVVNGSSYSIYWEIEKLSNSSYIYSAEIYNSSNTRIFRETVLGVSFDVYNDMSIDFDEGSDLIVNFNANGQLRHSYNLGSLTSWNISNAWLGGANYGGGTYIFNFANSYINYGAPTTYSIMLETGSNGSVSPASSLNTVNKGADLTFTITPDSGYKIETITTSSGSFLIDSANPVNHDFTNIQAVDSLSVTFALIDTVARYRLYNPNSGFHFWTTNFAEDAYLGSLGWNQEGANYRMYSGEITVDGEVSKPYYRLYNPNSGRHFWTSNEAEYNFLGSIGWNQEGINGYLFLTSVTGTMPLYRLYNPNSGGHFWTVSEAEYNYLGSIGWNQEGIAGYVLSN